MWNFFRLENEHLNNVGHFRAVSDVPLPYEPERVASLRASQSMAALNLADGAAEEQPPVQPAAVMVRVQSCPETLSPAEMWAAEERRSNLRAQDRLEYTRNPQAESEHEDADVAGAASLDGHGDETATTVRFEGALSDKEAVVPRPSMEHPAMTLRVRRSPALRRVEHEDYETEEPAPDQADTRRQFRDLDLPFDKGDRKDSSDADAERKQ